MENFAIITAVVSLFTPWIMDIFNLWIAKIAEENARKSVQFLVKNLLAVGFALIVNFVFGYGADVQSLILVALGIGQTTGEIAYRARKAVNGK